MVARVTGRVRLRDSFVADLTDQLLVLAYLMIPLPDGFAFLPLDVAEGFTRISSQRVSSELREAHLDNTTEKDLLGKLAPWGENTGISTDDDGE